MEDWTSQIISAIDEKLKNARPADLRFFRVEEFKRNVERVGLFRKMSGLHKEKDQHQKLLEKSIRPFRYPGKIAQANTTGLSTGWHRICKKNTAIFTLFILLTGIRFLEWLPDC
jgi:hypothetical protein